MKKTAYIICGFLLFLVLSLIIKNNIIQYNNNSILIEEDNLKINSIHNTNPAPYWIFNSTDYVMCVSISSDGQYIAAGGFNNQIYLFHNSSSIPLWSYTAIEYLKDIAISSDGNYIIASTKPSSAGYSWAYFFHKSSPTPLWTYSTNTDWMRHVAISANGSYITVVTDRVYLFEKSSSTPLWIYPAGGLDSLAISDDGQYIVAGGGYPTTHVYLFHQFSPTPLWIYDCSQVWSAAISSDGKYIVSGDQGGNITLFERSNSNPIWFYNTNDSVWSVSISKDAKYIAAGCSDGFIYFFESNSSSPTWKYQTGDLVRSAKLSDYGKNLLVGCEDHSIYYFYTSDSEPHWKFTTKDKILSADVSSNGVSTVAGGFDNNVYYFFKSNDNTPPSITNITVSKEVIKIGETQNITCHVIDDNGIRNVTVDLKNSVENISISLNLYDDGTHGDLFSGDGTFSISWDSSDFPIGNYSIDVKAIDNSSVGNIHTIDNSTMFILQEIGFPIIDGYETIIDGYEILYLVMIIMITLLSFFIKLLRKMKS